MLSRPQTFADPEIFQFLRVLVITKLQYKNAKEIVKLITMFVNHSEDCHLQLARLIKNI